MITSPFPYLGSVLQSFYTQVMPNILYTLEGASEFSKTIVFCALVKNRNNLPRLAEILKASEGLPSPLAKLCLIS